MKTQQEIIERFQGILDLRFGELECDEGWYDLIWETLEKVEKELPEDFDENWKIPIIKEKYGTLRFQHSIGTDEIWDIFDSAEKKSETTCEHCGSPDAKSTNEGWYRTLCDNCKTNLDKN